MRAQRLGDHPGVPGLIPALALGLALALPQKTLGATNPGAPLLDATRAFRISGWMEPGRLVIRYRIEGGYYLYKKKVRLTVEPASAPAGPARLPAGRQQNDEFFGPVEVYRDRVDIPIPLKAGNDRQRMTVRAVSQGCADAGVCYPPREEILVLVPDAGETGARAVEPPSRSLLEQLEFEPTPQTRSPQSSETR